MTELCPVQLETLPLFQKIGIGQFGRDGRSKTVLSNPTVQLMLEEDHLWKHCIMESSRTCRSCCCSLTSCWLSFRSDSNRTRSLWCSRPTPVWPGSSQLNRPNWFSITSCKKKNFFQISLLRLFNWGLYRQTRDPPVSSAPASICEPHLPLHGHQGSPQPEPDIYLLFAHRSVQPLHLTES